MKDPFFTTISTLTEEETHNWHSSSISQERLCETGAIQKLQMS